MEKLTMEKLIEELEARKNEVLSRGNLDHIDEGIAVGIGVALNIIRSHNPWTSVEELPEKGTVINHLSIVVWCTDGDRRSIGYYNFRISEWVVDGGFTPTHWAYLPEVPHE